MTTLKVKETFQWHRPCSCIPGPIEVPAGAPVMGPVLTEGVHKETYWVRPEFFQDAIVRHDAIFYGCRVAKDNVEENLK